MCFWVRFTVRSSATPRSFHRAFVGHAQVFGQLLDEEHGQAVVLRDEGGDDIHGDEADDRRLEGGSGRDVVFAREVGAVAEVFDGLDHADNLAASAHTVLVDLHLAAQQTHQVRGGFAFAMDHFIFFVILKGEVAGEELPLLVVQRRPHVGNELRNFDI